ncbi:MAG: sigma-70 family RNA polymerase sigma factor [Bacteroidia bacterium]
MEKSTGIESDTRIVDDIKAGGKRRESAALEIFKDYNSLIGMGIKRYGLKREVAIDALSDAIVGLVDQIAKGNFRGEAKLSSYLFRIFSWKCIDKLKKQQTYSREEDMPAFMQESNAATAPDPLQKLIAKDEHERLMRVINQLGGGCKKLIVDLDYYGFTLQETAVRNGYKNTQTVSSKRYQCIKKLKALLADFLT